MKTRQSTAAIFASTVFVPGLADVGVDPAPYVETGGCRVQLTELVAYLKETAEIEGIVLSVEYAKNTTILNHPNFAQHMTCIGGVLQIEIKDPKSD